MKLNVSKIFSHLTLYDIFCSFKGIGKGQHTLSLHECGTAKSDDNLKTMVVEESLVMQRSLSNVTSSMTQAYPVVLQEVMSGKPDAKDGHKILAQIGIRKTHNVLNNNYCNG